MIRTRIAAVTLSIAAIITAGVVNTAGAASGPYVPPTTSCATSPSGCQGAKIEQPAPTEAPAVVEDDGLVSEPGSLGPKYAPRPPAKPKPAPVAVAPTVETDDGVEAPHKAAEPKSGCN